MILPALSPQDDHMSQFVPTELKQRLMWTSWEK